MTNKDINSLNSKIKRLEAKKNDLIKRARYESSQKYRKDRARRLIETGALAEKYFNLHNLSLEEREELFKMFEGFINANKLDKFKK